MSDKRTYQRFNVQMAARFRLFNAPFFAFRVTVLDVGAEGLSFLSPSLLDIGQKLELHVFLEPCGPSPKTAGHLRVNDHEKIALKTEVIWLSRYDDATYKVGVKIIDAAVADESRFIKFYCSKLLALAETAK